MTMVTIGIATLNDSLKRARHAFPYDEIHVDFTVGTP